MSPFFTKEHNELREDVHSFALKEIAPVAREFDQQSRFPWENVRKMADMGLFGVNVPTEYGGQGKDFICFISVFEQLAGVDASH
jgi:alkylation response protein AidB-like acyl-CoA dehydrogenase